MLIPIFKAEYNRLMDDGSVQVFRPLGMPQPPKHIREIRAIGDRQIWLMNDKLASGGKATWGEEFLAPYGCRGSLHTLLTRPKLSCNLCRGTGYRSPTKMMRELGLPMPCVCAFLRAELTYISAKERFQLDMQRTNTIKIMEMCDVAWDDWVWQMTFKLRPVRTSR